MSQTNAYLIQEKLKNMEYISIPWLQTEYELSYIEAKEFLDMLKKRGWIQQKPNGINYKVIKENMCLRKLVREELDGIIEDVTTDCVRLLTAIEKKKGVGLSSSEISSGFCEDAAAKETIEILESHKLIYKIGDNYYMSVSEKITNVLAKVLRAKRSRGVNKQSRNESENSLVHLFDEFFD